MHALLFSLDAEISLLKPSFVANLTLPSTGVAVIGLGSFTNLIHMFDEDQNGCVTEFALFHVFPPYYLFQARNPFPSLITKYSIKGS